MNFKNVNNFKNTQADFALVKQEKKNWKGNRKHIRHKKLKIRWLLGCLPDKAVAVE